MSSFIGWIATQGFEDAPHVFMARIRGNSYELITQSNISAIGCKVFDRVSATPTTPVATPTVGVSTSIFDTLQTDGRWTADNASFPGEDGSYGYNFMFQVAGSVFSGAGRVYDVEFTFTPTSGEPIIAGFRHTTLPISSS